MVRMMMMGGQEQVCGVDDGGKGSATPVAICPGGGLGKWGCGTIARGLQCLDWGECV